MNKLEINFCFLNILFRVSLQSMLKFSSLYNASLLLSKIPEESGLDLETAMLYGRVSLVRISPCIFQVVASLTSDV